jgi:hypothetical protein
VFDAWLISEHNSRGFDPSWLSSTFSLAILGNSVVAIGSGVAAEFVADMSAMVPASESGLIMMGGYCAPFDLAALFLFAGGLLISTSWSENFGERGGQSESPLSTTALRSAWLQVKNNRSVMLCGLISSLFEGSMYTFVFHWSPLIQSLSSGGDEEEAAEAIPYGTIFATFMMSCMTGSSLFGILKARGHQEETFTSQVREW